MGPAHTGASPLPPTAFSTAPSRGCPHCIHTKAEWNNPVPDWTPVTLIGLGQTVFEEKSPKVLQEITDLALLPLKLCQKEVGELSRGYTFNNNTMICARRVEGLGGQCRGDSGGPMFVRGKTAADDMQIGVVSWSYKDTELPCQELPGVLTDVADVRRWIDASIRILTQPLTGSVTDDRVVCGFNKIQFKTAKPANSWLDILHSRGGFKLDAWLVRHPDPAVSAVFMQRIVFQWHDRVVVALLKDGRLSVTLNGKVVPPGITTSMSRGSVRFNAKSGASPEIIVVQPRLSIRIVRAGGIEVGRSQAASQSAGARTPWLNAWVTLTKPPPVKLGGVLAQTLPAILQPRV